MLRSASAPATRRRGYAGLGESAYREDMNDICATSILGGYVHEAARGGVSGVVCRGKDGLGSVFGRGPEHGGGKEGEEGALAERSRRGGEGRRGG